MTQAPLDLPYKLPAGYYPPPPYPRASSDYVYLPPRANIHITLKNSTRPCIEKEHRESCKQGIREHFTGLAKAKHFDFSRNNPNQLSFRTIAFGFRRFDIEDSTVSIEFVVEYCVGQDNVDALRSQNFGRMMSSIQLLGAYLEELLQQNPQHKLRTFLKTLPLSAEEIVLECETSWDEAGRILPYSTQRSLSNDIMQSILRYEMNSLYHRWNRFLAQSQSAFPLEIPGSILETEKSNGLHSMSQDENQTMAEDDTELNTTEEDSLELHLPFPVNGFESQHIESAESYLETLALEELVAFAQSLAMSQVRRNKRLLIDDIVDHLLAK